MKTVKLLLLSTLMFVVPAVAMDLQQSRKAAIDRADMALFAAIDNCHRNDGKHNLRIDELQDSTYNLPALEVYYVLQRRFKQVMKKSGHFPECNDCKDVESFVGQVLQATVYDIDAGRGNMTISELRKLHVNK